MSEHIETEDTETPTDDFGNPLTTCAGCGQITQCARGLCWWCLVSEEDGDTCPGK